VSSEPLDVDFISTRSGNNLSALGGAVLAADTVDILAVTGIIGAALVTALAGLVVARSSEWVQWLFASATHTIELQLSGEAELARYRWKVLHIRDGSDETMAQLSEREKGFARLRNKTGTFKGPAAGSAARRAKLRFYRPLGLQFKCFVDVTDEAAARSVQHALEANGCSEVEIAGEREEKGRTFVRVWFLHPHTGGADSGARYSIVTAPNGAKNNFFHPA
jgi:hypothetical protein